MDGRRIFTLMELVLGLRRLGRGILMGLWRGGKLVRLGRGILMGLRRGGKLVSLGRILGLRSLLWRLRLVGMKEGGLGMRWWRRMGHWIRLLFNVVEVLLLLPLELRL